MEKAEGGNGTFFKELILLGFGNDPELQPLLFLLFLVIYLVSVAGNLIIVVLVVADQHLQTPMYYFVANLSTVEICYVSTTLPRLLASLATGDRTISLQNCIVQFNVYVILSNAECNLLTAMCIDRYLVISHPLRYPALMNGRVCGHMVAWAWIYGIAYSIMLQVFILHSTYCGPKELDFLFCDIGRIYYPFCGANVMTFQELTFIVSIISNIVILVFTLVTYIFPVIDAIFQKVIDVWFLVMVPLLNPILYCLRNKEVHQSLRKARVALLAFRHKPGV
ncbi:olfactory receptor 10G4-like [Pelodiscus sinensis]|uniref:olfactory receptor 10G4-like n=1 Tax=Pelodiscus sinensis TaxID=13735 RepID=UPI003F6D9D20